MKTSKYTLLIFFITLTLFIIPFFWLKPGEMDLGGDSNRLYFYDPISMLKEFGIYSIAPYGTGILIYNQYFLPFLLFIISLKSIFHSPTALIAIFNGLKLSGSFIFVFLIIKELLKKEEREKFTLYQFLVAILGAIFYTFSPSVIENMRYALVTHSQVFLNPMIFYFLLRYLVTSSMKYIWLALFVTFIFSSSFALYNPPLFAFYPLAIAFLLLYNFFILKKSFPWKGAIVGILFFLGLHAFHLIPVASNIFDKGSEFNTRVFESASKINVGLEYFNATLQFGKVSKNILLPLEEPILSWSLLFIPSLIILGFLSMRRKNKTLSLISIFFFITLFLGSANITQLGVEFYRKLFLIPGFGMFRNFSGQWQWVYTFFYALLAGITISYLFSRLRRRHTYIILIVTAGCLLARSWVVFNGDIVNVFNRGSKNLKVVMRMDPHYEELLAYLKKIPNDGKIFHVPFTDFAYNLVGGSNGGVYVGQSMVSLLVGRNDFSGYHDIDPFSEVLVKISREKNYALIKQMLSLLQVRYVLYNSDPLISEKFFPTFPYGYTGVPASPSAALDFVRNISHKKIYETGYYSLYEVDKEQYLPSFYIASDLFFYDTNPKYNAQYFKASSFFPKTQQDTSSDPRVVYIEREACSKILPKDICDKNNHKLGNENTHVIFQKINPTKYRVEIKNATKPFLLVFQNSFTPKWKLYESEENINPKDNSKSYYNGSIVEFDSIKNSIDNNPFQTNSLKPVYANTHVEVNGYANAWYIDPGNILTQDYELIAEMDGQKIFYYSLAVSLISLLTFLLYGIKLLKK